MARNRRLLSGDLDRRVTLQRDTGTTVNEHGEPVRNWTALAPRWASIEPLTGQELTQAGAIVAGVTHSVMIRPYAGLTPKDRLLYGTRILNIASVIDPKEETEHMELLCREEV